MFILTVISLNNLPALVGVSTDHNDEVISLDNLQVAIHYSNYEYLAQPMLH